MNNGPGSVPTPDDATRLGQALKGVLFEDGKLTWTEFEVYVRESLESGTGLGLHKWKLQSGRVRPRSDITSAAERLCVVVPADNSDSNKPYEARKFEPLFPDPAD